jgi:hypothetical protein
MENKEINCSACGILVDEPADYTNKCKDCYYQEAKIFFLVIGGLALLFSVIVLIRHLKGGKW